MLNKQLIRFWKPLAAITFWGLSFIGTKILLSELSPMTIVWLRLSVAIPSLLILAAVFKVKFILEKKTMLGIVLLAFISLVHLWIQVTGMKYTSASNTGWIIGTAPLFVTICGYLFLKEKITSSTFIGFSISMAGLLLLISHGNISNLSFAGSKGDLMVLASSVTWGFYSIVNKKIAVRFSPLLTILYLFIIMFLFLFPLMINTETINAIIHLSGKGWVAVFFLGLFSSAAGYVLWAQALKEMGAIKTGSFIYIEPFVTVIGAYFILSEALTVLMIISGLIITAGVLVANRK